MLPSGLAINDCLTVYRLPVLRDNYIFVLHDRVLQVSAVVDPAVAQPVIDLLTVLDAPLVAIFNTHHHHDHVGGNQELVARYPATVVYGGSRDRGRIPYQQQFLEHGDRVPFGSTSIEVLLIPGHTKAHIAYWLPTTGDLFCGDTLFGCGCGRIFDGTPTDFFHSLQRLRQLPPETRVWCAHEYTEKNIRFALTIEPDNPHLLDRLQKLQPPTIPTSIGLEKLTNPFLRWDADAIQARLHQTDPLKVFTKLRGMRDLY
jgi:hydroxyacylglutathione hydrolase